MAYVPVPKDLSKVKTKVALNLTKRQIICFSLAGVFGLPVYFFTKSKLGTDVAAVLMVIVMLPFFFFAMYEKDGFPAEKIVFHIIRQKWLRPGIRPYKTENMYDRMVELRKIEKEGAKLERKEKAGKKTITECIRTIFSVSQTTKETKGRTNSRKKSSQCTK